LIIAVDEKLYSRQLYVMGHEAQRRMMASRALLIGLSGLGAEVAKNCILAGLSSLTLCDCEPVNSYDLGGNFYLAEDQIGHPNRALLVKEKLAELNPYVHVDVASVNDHSAASLLPLLSGMTCVVITIPLPKALLMEINDKCRELNCSFIYSLTTGVFGQVFCDFGENFVVSDKDGNPPLTSQIESVLSENPAVIKVLEDHGRHGLETEDFVQFARLKHVEGFGGKQTV
jgi:ubiquitin-activating enzyme E1